MRRLEYLLKLTKSALFGLIRLAGALSAILRIEYLLKYAKFDIFVFIFIFRSKQIYCNVNI